MRSWLLPAFFCAAVSGGCTDDVQVHLETAGFAADDVVLEVEDLGRPDAQALSELRRRGDIDGATLLSDADCGGPCQILLISLFVSNVSGERAAPPVVRFSAPAGKAERAPVAYRGDEISPTRAGRIRFLVALWPDETQLTVRLSGSVFFEVHRPEPETEPAAPTAPTPLNPKMTSPPEGSSTGS